MIHNSFDFWFTTFLHSFLSWANIIVFWISIHFFDSSFSINLSRDSLWPPTGFLDLRRVFFTGVTWEFTSVGNYLSSLYFLYKGPLLISFSVRQISMVWIWEILREFIRTMDIYLRFVSICCNKKPYGFTTVNFVSSNSDELFSVNPIFQCLFMKIIHNVVCLWCLFIKLKHHSIAS